MANSNFNVRGQRIDGFSSPGSGLTCLQCAAILSIPLGSLLVGYCIGVYFMPERLDVGDFDAVARPLRLNYSWYNSHNLTIGLVGRLGNQMFEYAAMYGIARANGLRPHLMSTDNELTRTFSGLSSSGSDTSGYRPGGQWRKFKESAANKFDSRAFNLNFMTHIELQGFYQSWRYFDHVRADVRQQFRFKTSSGKVDTFLLEAASNLTKLRRRKANVTLDRSPRFIGVHVRRGDLINNKAMADGYTTATPKYIATAMKYFNKKWTDYVIFIISTDDKEWCEANVVAADNVVYSPFYSAEPTLDLQLLSRCNHSIITVGTFGWWGATLAGGEVVYFKDFPKTGSSLSRGFHRSDYYPLHWIAM